ncbi:OmpA family protein [Vibrio parahaemolyticus]
MVFYSVYKTFIGYFCMFPKSWKCKIYNFKLSLFFVLRVFLLASLSYPSISFSGQTVTIPMDLSNWSYKGNKFECELLHSDCFVGKFYFRSEIKDKVNFIVELKDVTDLPPKVELISQSAPWGNELNRNVQSSLTFAKPSRRFLFLDGVIKTLDSIAEGDWIVLAFEGGGSDSSALSEVRIPTIQMQKALSEFNACRKRLPKLSFSQARDIVLPFQFGQKTLNATQQQTLAALYSYLSVDDRVTKVLIDGHTDNVGPRLTNLSVSRLRAQQVADTLITLGVKPNMIEVRAHGERYPTAKNSTAAGQAKNRRVTLRLVRDNERTIEKNTMYVQQQIQQKKVKVQ